MNETDRVKCDLCEMLVNQQDTRQANGQTICEGCAQGLAEDPSDDPHGRGFTNNNNY